VIFEQILWEYRSLWRFFYGMLFQQLITLHFTWFWGTNFKCILILLISSSKCYALFLFQMKRVHLYSNSIDFENTCECIVWRNWCSFEKNWNHWHRNHIYEVEVDAPERKFNCVKFKKKMNMMRVDLKFHVNTDQHDCFCILWVIELTFVWNV